MPSYSLLQEGKVEELPQVPRELFGACGQGSTGRAIVCNAARSFCARDLVLLEAGDKVPADIRLIESHSMSCNESSLQASQFRWTRLQTRCFPQRLPWLTGSTWPISGTAVTAGRGRGIVVSTGMDTEMGKIAGAIHSISRQDPLQRNLERLGKTSG